jgi:hypothetical protein
MLLAVSSSVSSSLGSISNRIDPAALIGVDSVMLLAMRACNEVGKGEKNRRGDCHRRPLLIVDDDGDDDVLDGGLQEKA